MSIAQKIIDIFVKVPDTVDLRDYRAYHVALIGLYIASPLHIAWLLVF